MFSATFSQIFSNPYHTNEKLKADDKRSPSISLAMNDGKGTAMEEDVSLHVCFVYLHFSHILSKQIALKLYTYDANVMKKHLDIHSDSVVISKMSCAVK